MTPDEEIRAAKDANRIFGDPVFQKAFESIESRLFDAMRQVKIGDRDSQHELILSLQLLGNIKGYFKTMIESGKMAELQKEQSMAQKVRALVRR